MSVISNHLSADLRNFNIGAGELVLCNRRWSAQDYGGNQQTIYHFEGFVPKEEKTPCLPIGVACFRSKRALQLPAYNGDTFSEDEGGIHVAHTLPTDSSERLKFYVGKREVIRGLRIHPPCLSSLQFDRIYRFMDVCEGKIEERRF